LRCPLANRTRSRPRAAAKCSISAVNAAVIGAISAEEANRCPRCPTKNAAIPAPCCSRGWYRFVEVHAVDCLDLKQHVTSQHIGGRTR